MRSSHQSGVYQQILVKDFTSLDYSALVFELFPIMEMKGADDVAMPSIWESPPTPSELWEKFCVYKWITEHPCAGLCSQCGASGISKRVKSAAKVLKWVSEFLSVLNIIRQVLMPWLSGRLRCDPVLILSPDSLGCCSGLFCSEIASKSKISLTPTRLL